MRFLLSSLLLLAVMTAAAQASFTSFQWAPQPVLHDVNPEFRDEAAVYIADNKTIEYVIEKDGFYLYKTVHRIVHINSDKGIEYFNKVYLPFEEDMQMITVKARTVLPGGKVLQFDERNIKEIKEEEQTYKIFALDGLTKGCEVEYYYTLKTYPSFFGREIMGARIPAQKVQFELLAPEHLKFEVRTYNNLPPCKDTIANEKSRLWLTAENVPAAVEEKYAMYDANIKRVEYKLCYNRSKNPGERMFTWNELAKKAFEIYTSVPEKETKRIKELVAAAGVQENMTEQEKLVRLEQYFKKNFLNREDVPDEDANDLPKAIKSKVMSNKALCKLYCAAFSLAGVSYQMVLTGDRENYTLDRSFENWNSARNILFYFPSTGKYLAPTEIIYSYPWIPPTWAGANGLYCVGTVLGQLKTAVAEIKPVRMEAYEHTYLNMEVKMELEKNEEALLMEVKQLYGGYAAANYRAPFVFAPAEEQNKVLKELIKFGTNSENILSHSLENKELEGANPFQPFVISAKVRSTQLVERAGEKIIIKVGEIIGQQAEMYNTKERTNPIDLGFPHALVRTIELTIPEGYTIKNLNDLNFNQVVEENGKLTMGFVCTYEQQGNKLKLKIQEDYTRISYPVDQFAAFMKIINTAADFNTAVLVLEKKG